MFSCIYIAVKYDKFQGNLQKSLINIPIHSPLERRIIYLMSSNMLVDKISVKIKGRFFMRP